MKPKISKSEAINELWQRGELSWKLDASQKELYNLFYDSSFKIQTWLLSRRSGKTFTLLVLALEQLISYPNTIVKFLSPTKLQCNTNVRPLIKQILEDCPEHLKPAFSGKDYIFFFPNGSELQLAGSDSGHAEKLRGGCFSGDTEIMTPYGPRMIKDICVGDEVYGIDENLQSSITKVKNIFHNGNKKVTQIIRDGKVLAACTDEHQFLTLNNSRFHRKQFDKTKIKKFKNLNKLDKIIRLHQNIPCGLVQEKHAYLIGAFIGDGCATHSYNQLIISSIDDKIPNKIAKVLGCHIKNPSKYAWYFGSSNVKNKHSEKITFNYYKEWIEKKNFLNKNFNWDIVDTWDRDSCLDLLAGLIDTDGSVSHNKKDNSLELSYNSSNLNLLYNIHKLIFKLFQFRASIKSDDRDKYTHPHYRLRIRNSYYVKRILKELENKLVSEQKKYKPAYDLQPSKENNFTSMISLGESYETGTYDLEVDNASHLYLTADGLVTHNSSWIAIVDEAGEVKDLDNTVKSILLPTTLTTKGKILLAGTPPKTPDHDFVKFIEEADVRGSLIKKDVYSNPRLSKEQIEELISELGGINSSSCKRELFCQLVQDENSVVIPEFSPELEKEIVKDWPTPPFYDSYVAMDLGFKDLTALLFGYFDFRSNKIIIQDELSFNFNEEDNHIKKLTEEIEKKEAGIWFNHLTNELKKPYTRVSDINYIVMSEINLHSGGKINFIETKKDHKEAALSNLRVLLGSKKIIINPKCTTLIRHLKNAKWHSKTEKDRFARSPDNGHYDFIDALIYFIRAIQFNRNPYPPGYDVTLSGAEVFYPSKASRYNSNNQIETFRKIFGVKKR